jgi:tRNA-splicing ligase RtcB
MMNNIRWFTNPDTVEADAVLQVGRTASMPFVKGLAVMPDVHYGKGSTVGTVIATKGAIIPAAVGVDIGCGMIAVRTTLAPEAIRPYLTTIREGIERRIPTGIGPRGQNSRLHPGAEMRTVILESEATVAWNDVNHMNARAKDWRLQVGSLGGGNHFIEVCIGQSFPPISEVGVLGPKEVWIILHSGSRAVGNKVGTHWTNVAKKQAARYMYDAWLPDPDLAYLVEHSEEYWEYLKEVYWCQRFAQLNRDEMMDRVLCELGHTLQISISSIELERINCHHNYVSKEMHHGESVTITRKGAILAADGVRGLIPGSMGARSYIVSGLGHFGSYNSAPHGAGRRMSRSAARKLFTVEQVTMEMKGQGIECRMRPAILDEAPGSYKDIDQVIDEAYLLVRPTHVLKQLISIKGD